MKAKTNDTAIDEKVRATLYERYYNLKKEVKAIEIKIEVLGFKHPENGVIKTEDVPQSYSPYLSWENKVLFALNNLYTGGVVNEIVDFLKGVDTDIKDEVAQARVRQYASQLYRSGKLDAVKLGKKFKYSLVRK